MNRFSFIFLFMVAIWISSNIYGDDTALDTSTRAVNTSARSVDTGGTIAVSEGKEVATPEPETIPNKETVAPTKEETAGNITLDFKDADIRSVLKIISLKTGVNIVASPDVTGNVTIYLDDVPWEKALDVILKTYGFGYEKRANVIAVAPLEKLTEQKKLEQELAQVQPTITEVFQLKYIDALDAKIALEPLISPRGKITVLESTGKAGWKFGSESLSKREVVEKTRKSLTKVLLITDIPPVIDDIKAILEKIDKKPKQIMIEAKILEVSRDYLEDIGFEYSTQTVGASDITDNIFKDKFGAGVQVVSSSSGTPLTPSIFSSPTTSLSPQTAGMSLIFKKLVGNKWQVIFRALEEDVNSNLLSAPRIMTLDNQEATILVGEKYPILTTTASQATTTVTLQSLDYYQDIGIQLNVVPQISGDNKINMIIHPAVSSFTQTVGTNAYPRINTREAETQVLMNDGETIVIGGLIKDYDNKSKIGIPFLSKIPLLGALFRRDTKDVAKIELLIFITATIVDESGSTETDTSFLEKQISKNK